MCRLADQILIAFNQACDQDDLEVASHLVNVLENFTVSRVSAGRSTVRQSAENLITAHERLWRLQGMPRRLPAYLR